MASKILDDPISVKVFRHAVARCATRRTAFARRGARDGLLQRHRPRTPSLPPWRSKAPPTISRATAGRARRRPLPKPARPRDPSPARRSSTGRRPSLRSPVTSTPLLDGADGRNVVSDAASEFLQDNAPPDLQRGCVLGERRIRGAPQQRRSGDGRWVGRVGVGSEGRSRGNPGVLWGWALMSGWHHAAVTYDRATVTSYAATRNTTTRINDWPRRCRMPNAPFTTRKAPPKGGDDFETEFCNAETRATPSGERVFQKQLFLQRRQRTCGHLRRSERKPGLKAFNHPRFQPMVAFGGANAQEGLRSAFPVSARRTSSLPRPVAK